MQVTPEELRLWKLTGTFTTGLKGKRRKIQFLTSTKKTEAYLNTNIYRNENVHGHPVTNFTSTNHSLHSNPIVIFMPNSLSGYRPVSTTIRSLQNASTFISIPLSGSSPNSFSHFTYLYILPSCMLSSSNTDTILTFRSKLCHKVKVHLLEMCWGFFCFFL